MRLHRLSAGAVALAAVGLLGGCEVQEQFPANCTTSPPVPHQNYGTVEVDVEIPPQVAPGETFTVRVDMLTAYPGVQGGSGSYAHGELSVTGPVTPSGTFSVGERFFSGSPYPNTLELTVTGRPGEEIRLEADSGGSFFGVFPDRGYEVNCRPAGDSGEIAVIPIVEPS